MLDGSTPSFAKMLEYCEDEVLISAKGDEVEKTLPISFSQEKTYRMKS